MSRQVSVKELKKLYASIKNRIHFRISKFRQIWDNGDDKDIFAELVFCILTPQSKAKMCWATVENLKSKNILLKGKESHILKELILIRFKYKKAHFIKKAQEQFLKNGKPVIKSRISQFRDVYEIRDWLVSRVKGIGYKEASHFLRNIGKSENLAILDRHILKNLKLFSIIKNIPDSLLRKKYIEIEKRMKKFASNINIPLSHLDLLFWYKETGEVFK